VKYEEKSYKLSYTNAPFGDRSLRAITKLDNQFESSSFTQIFNFYFKVFLLFRCLVKYARPSHCFVLKYYWIAFTNIECLASSSLIDSIMLLRFFGHLNSTSLCFKTLCLQSMVVNMKHF